jgi:hypothetical protein
LAQKRKQNQAHKAQLKSYRRDHMGSNMDKRSQLNSEQQAQQFYQQQQMYYPQQNYAAQSTLIQHPISKYVQLF